jgi:cytochrome c biogenesis protein CcdA
MPDIILALLAGILTIAAPCTLPVLPILLGASIGQASSARPAMIALGFVVSFSFVALALNSLATVLNFDPDTLRTAGIVSTAAFGALMLWPALFERWSSGLSRVADRASTSSAATAQTNFGGFLLGTTLGLVWTPCAGPVLGSILTAIATSADHGHGAVLLLSYTIGAALPMLAIAYGGQAVTTRLRGIAPYASRLQQAFGVIVIAFSAAAWLQYDTLAIAWLSQLFPEGRVGL